MPLSREDYEQAAKAGAEADAAWFGQPVNIPGLTFSDDQTYQIVGAGNDTVGWSPRPFQWGNARNKPMQPLGDNNSPAPEPDMGSYGMAGPAYPASYLHNYLDQFYKQYTTPEAVRNRNLEDVRESAQNSSKYWSAVVANDNSKFAHTGMIADRMRDAKDWVDGGGYTPPEPVRSKVGGQWVMPNDPRHYDSRVGEHETRIKQSDGRSDVYRPGVGYHGSIYEGASLANARKVFESQQDRTFAVPSPKDYARAQAAAGATSTDQIPLPGGGLARAPKGPMPDNVERVITAPTGQVIGWVRKYDSPEAAQAASNASREAREKQQAAAPSTKPTPKPTT